MLQSIRDRAQSWFAWAIIILLIIPFALWGVYDYFGGGEELVVASVNGQDITLRQFQQAYYQHMQRLRSMLGASFRADMFDEGQMKKTVLRRMVREQAMGQAVLSGGFRVGDAALAAEIRSINAFKRDGRFDQTQYEDLLRNRGLSTAQFEDQMRRSMVLQQLENGVAATAVVLPWEVDAAIRLQHEQRDVGYLIVPRKRFLAAITPDDAAIQHYYDAHKTGFTTPEKVSIEYLELSLDQLAAEVPADEEELKRTYAERKAEWTTPEQRHAQHILVQVPKDADAATVAAARKKVEALLKRVKGGEDFAAVAKEASDDKGSAAHGGDLGFFGKGMMVAPFEDKVFTMKPGEISDLVRTPFGFHIIKLLEVKPASHKPYQEVRPQLLKDYQRTRAENRFYEQADTLANLTYEQPDSLAPAAKALDLKVQEAGPFDSKGGTGITANPKVVSAAFSDNVKSEGLNSDVIELDSTHMVVLRVKQHDMPRQRSLEDVREAIVTTLKQRQAHAKAQELGVEILDGVRAGKAPAELAKTHELEWHAPRTLGRDDSTLDPALRDAAFRLSRPEEGKSSSIGLSLADGDYGVVQVTQVKDGDPASVGKDERKTVADGLRQARGQAEYDGVVEAMTAAADIKLFESKL